MRLLTMTTAVFGLTAITLTSCGGGEEAADGATLAKEVCECYTKANGLSADDPNREAEQKKCSELQTSNWEKVKGDTEQEKAFNGEFPCGI